MGIYEEFLNFVQKEYGKNLHIPQPRFPKTNPPTIEKGGVGSGRKASSSSKLSVPKRGSPIKIAISRYQKKPSPSLHQKIVEAFRGKEKKKEKIEDPLKGLKHPWDD